MYLVTEATIKNDNGTVAITLIVVKPEKKTFNKYTYVLPSVYMAEKFHQLYRKGSPLHGRAIAYLNKNKIRVEGGHDKSN